MCLDSYKYMYATMLHWETFSSVSQVLLLPSKEEEENWRLRELEAPLGLSSSGSSVVVTNSSWALRQGNTWANVPSVMSHQCWTLPWKASQSQEKSQNDPEKMCLFDSIRIYPKYFFFSELVIRKSVFIQNTLLIIGMLAPFKMTLEYVQDHM